MADALVRTRMRAQSDELVEAVSAFTVELQGAGEPIERVLVRLKEIIAVAGQDLDYPEDLAELHWLADQRSLAVSCCIKQYFQGAS